MKTRGPQLAEDGVARGFVRVIGGLGLAGVVLGVIWWAWSPPRPRAFVIDNHRFAGLFDVAALQPAEAENWIASDGRFVILTGALGLLAGYAAWHWRSARGPVIAAALAAGGVVGAAITGLVGFLLGGGQLTGKPNTVIVTRLNVHAYGFYFVQAALSVAVYCICVAFARDDDLGRPDPWFLPREPGDPRARPAGPSVGADGQA